MLIVQKFGGTSVGTLERIPVVADRCLKAQQAGNDVVVVVSAMAGETSRLLSLTKALHPQPDDREVDVVVSTGEQVTSGLLALAIHERGGKAVSLLGHQAGIHTDASHGRARIRRIDCDSIRAALASGSVTVVAGFQGVDDHGNITTLGRGGSDTSAVALAAALKADLCEIYTDVEGVFTADPNIVHDARKIDRISYEEMLELSSMGAKVLQLRSVEFGMKYNVPIHVRSSFSQSEGTWVMKEDETMEAVLVSGVTATTNEAKITLANISNRPGTQAEIFRPLADEGVVVDVIVQAMVAAGRTNITFTLPEDDVMRARQTLLEHCKHICTKDTIQVDKGLSKVSVVGVGMRSHAGVAQKMFEILAQENIEVHLISTSEIKISCVISAKYGELAVRALHEGFGLGQDRTS